MTTPSQVSIRQQTANITLSKPVQATLYTLLCASTLWTLFFTTNPAIHDRLHSIRHHTLMISCH